jgi:hypothetical protein
MKQEKSGVKDLNGKMIREGDLLLDRTPSKGIVVFSKGEFWVTSDYQDRDITILDSDCDLLNEDLIFINKMVVVGSIYTESLFDEKELEKELDNYFKNVSKEQFILDLEKSNCLHLVEDINQNNK